VIRGKNHSVIAAISPSRGLLTYRIKPTEKDDVYETKGVGAEVFKEFIQELLEIDFIKARGVCLSLYCNG
jgi:hypothetical protein